MGRYKLQMESDGNLGIYCSDPETWLGSILEPDSSNPALALGIPLGIIGVQKILNQFKEWKAGRRSASGNRQPPPGSDKCREPTRKWRRAYRAKK